MPLSSYGEEDHRYCINCKTIKLIDRGLLKYWENKTWGLCSIVCGNNIDIWWHSPCKHWHLSPYIHSQGAPHAKLEGRFSNLQIFLFSKLFWTLYYSSKAKRTRVMSHNMIPHSRIGINPSSLLRAEGGWFSIFSLRLTIIHK